MHEMGLVDAIVRKIDVILKTEDVEGISKVVLEIGELSGIVPRFMEDCWGAVTAGGRYEDTELEIRIIPGTIRCMDCGEHFRSQEMHLKCPKCGGERLLPLSGRDMTILELEAY